MVSVVLSSPHMHVVGVGVCAWAKTSPNALMMSSEMA